MLTYTSVQYVFHLNCTILTRMSSTIIQYNIIIFILTCIIASQVTHGHIMHHLYRHTGVMVYLYFHRADMCCSCTDSRKLERNFMSQRGGNKIIIYPASPINVL